MSLRGNDRREKEEKEEEQSWHVTQVRRSGGQIVIIRKRQLASRVDSRYFNAAEKTRMEARKRKPRDSVLGGKYEKEQTKEEVGSGG